MKGLRYLLTLGCVSGLIVSSASHALQQEADGLFTSPELNRDYNYNYQELNNIDPSVQTLTTDLFGDTIDPASGALRFSQTDVSLPGNFALPVAVTRTLGDPSGWHRENLLFGNWSLDIPHVRSTAVTNQRVGHKYDNAYWLVGEACSRPLNSNPDFSAGTSSATGSIVDVQGYYLESRDYWTGDTAYIPGQGSATFLDTDPGDTNYDPSNPTKRFNNQNWDVTCYDDPDRSNEGFEITTGNGTTYFFSQPLIRTDTQLRSMLPVPQIMCGSSNCEVSLNPSSGDETYTRTQHQLFMLVTKVVDKFGNEVNYTYTQGSGAQLDDRLADDDPRLDVRLTNISASDGREIELTYNTDGNISQVKTVNAEGVQDRVWEYTYNSAGVLGGVTQPNGQAWSFDNGDSYYSGWRELFPPAPLYGDGCFDGVLDSTVSPRFITITHPYGMQAEFILTAQCFGQFDVPEVKQFNPSQLSERQTYWIKRENRSIVLKNKTLTFTDGTAPYIWTYDYSDNKGTFEDEVPENCTSPAQSVGETCQTVRFNNTHRADLKTTTTTQPNGDYSIHYFDRTYGIDRDNLVAMETYEANGTLLSRSSYEYDQSVVYGDNRTILNAIVPAGEGYTRPDGLKNSYRDESLIRTVERTTELFNGASSSLGSYTQQILAFDIYNQPTRVRGSSAQGTRFIRYGYLPKTAKGVFNLPTTVDISTSNSNYTQVSNTTYKNLSSANSVKVPHQIFGYGQLKQTHVSYHTTTGEIGQPKRVDYNAPLTTGSGSRYMEYLDYHRGVPREVRMPQRRSTGTQSVKRTVDDNGWVTSYTDLNGNTTRYGYDDMGRFRFIDQPGTTQWLDTVFTWTPQTNSAGPRRTERRCALSGDDCSGGAAFTETLQFDNLLRPTLTTRAGSGMTRYQNKTFDSYNQETFASFWSNSATDNNGTTNTFDALQRLTEQATTGLGSVETDYLPDNRMRTLDANGNITTTTYRAYGQPSYNQATLIVSPEGVTTSLSVDVFGLVNTISQGGETEYRAYNNFKQLCQVKRDDVGTTAYTLNALGQPTAMASGIQNADDTTCAALPNNLRVTTVYDNLGDVRTMNYPDSSPDLTYDYDRQGNLTSLQAGTVTHTYTYNSLHLLESERLVQPGKTLTLDYAYNTLGHVASLTYPNSDVVSFAPNAFGEPTQASGNRAGISNITYASNATYYPTGQVDTFNYGNGIAHKTTLNAARLPIRIRDSRTGLTALDYTYSYDNNQNVTKLTDHLNAAFSIETLTYDGLDRLETVTAGAAIGNSALTYDELGNIKTYNNKQQHLTYHYNPTSNQLDRVEKTDAPAIPNYRVFSYEERDSNDEPFNRGNVTNNGYRSFTYNLANQMIASGDNTYLYDGHNRRVKQTDSNGTSYSIYSQDGTLLYRETDSGSINYIYLGKRLVAKDGIIPENAGDQHFYPYGSSVEGEIDDAGYTGHKFDTDLGLSYMQARYYDPMIGRFYSNDPVGFKPSDISTFNRYSYVSNNPYKYVDPDGREKHTIAVTGEAIAVAGARVSLSLSFDDQTFELSASVSASPRLGAGLSLTPSYQQSPSGDVAKNETIVETSVNADAAVGPFAVAQDLVSEKTINGDIQPQGSVSEPQGDAKGKVGVSASVGVEVKVTQSTTAIADAVNAVKEILE